MNIETLKQELREFIKLSETITPGRWEAVPRFTTSRMIEPCEVWCGDCSSIGIETVAANAAFIARSRNISPTMAKMLLVAVEGLERLYDDTEGYADGAPDASGHDRLCNEVSHVAKHQLQQLLKLWEETK
jgi:hypothetical protein